MTGARLLSDRRAGAVAGGLLAVAFLPVFYSHLALNDVPTLAPVALSLYGVAGVIREGRHRDKAIAGLGFGLAAATKYTAGIIVVALLAAAILAPRVRVGPARGLRARIRPAGGLAIGLAVAVAAFVAANPYAVLDPQSFLRGMSRQASATSGWRELGTSQSSGYRFYLEALTWGLGWAPAVAALAGAAALAARRSDRRVFWVLVPAVVVFIAFMGSQERYFGRWLIPVLPLVCVLAAAAALRAAEAVAKRARRPALATPVLALAALGLGAQGFIHSLHGDRVLARADTRELARAWMDRHVPRGRPYRRRAGDGRRLVRGSLDRHRGARRACRRRTAGGVHRRLLSKRSIGTRPLVRLRRSAGVVGGEAYQRTLSPGLIDRYVAAGACWVVTGSTQEGRGLAQPRQVPQAIAYYRALSRRATLAYRGRPEQAGRLDVTSTSTSPSTPIRSPYERPGSQLFVYHLRAGAAYPEGT